MSAKIYDPAFPDHDVVRRLDIGDQVRSKEASREAGALQTAIFNSVNFSSIATDANGVIQIFNVGAERMLGYTAAEVMMGKWHWNLRSSSPVLARLSWIEQAATRARARVTPGMSVAANGPETDCARGRCAEEDGGALLQLGGIRATEATRAVGTT